MPNMYEITVPTLLRALSNLDHILSKGHEHAKLKEIAPEVFFNARLFPDMFPLYRQVQIATDMSKGAVARLANIEIPKYEDNEATFEDLHARIAKTLAFIKSVRESQFEGAEKRDIELMVAKQKMEFIGLDYLLSWVLPNVYFHVTTAYDILRHNGVALGKSDFLRGAG